MWYPLSESSAEKEQNEQRKDEKCFFQSNNFMVFLMKIFQKIRTSFFSWQTKEN